MDLGRDSVLTGRYELREPLRKGGMGTLWRASDVVLGREVAIKLLLGHIVDDQITRERFQREARLLAMLRHPGITVVYDYGDHDGQPFIVMELLTGRDLEQIMRDHRRGLPLAQAADITAQAADALEAAHKQGITHRDIKPANLFLQDGPVHDGRRLKVCDFGIARDLAATSITNAGQAIGTPAFLAPEVWQGQPNSAKSDLYALGCVLYELLTGKPPFSVHHDRQTLYKLHLTETPRPPRGVPPRLSQVVAQMLAKDPDERPASAATVAAELRAIATAAGTQEASERAPAAPVPPVPRPSPVLRAPARLQPSAALVPPPPHFQARPADPTVRYTLPLPPGEGQWPGQAQQPDESARPRPTRWTRAIWAAAWLLFATVTACAGLAVAGWVPTARLWVLVPAAAYTLTGALAVSRAATAPGPKAAAAVPSFALAEAAAILLVTSVGPPEAWAAIMTLFWMGGILLTTSHGNDQ
jgi:tRNA A-37 threonylcarbamoyl transferase component Bud32